ncbi:MAG: phosphoribosyltransferase family protein [Vicingaceae bacterium]
MPDSKTQILDHKKIIQKVNRIAYQIYEDHYDQKEIILAGIAKNGFVFAEVLANKIEEISAIKVQLIELQIDKKNPIEGKAELKITEKEIKNKSIILVDDVLNSGRTLIYGMQVFLKAPIKRLSVAVLANRSHKRFPVNANYVGISLATTLKEHIEVDLDNPKAYAAYLS